jgi:DNA-nicking Smr family endonuclease
MNTDNDPFNQPIEMEINGELDLHTFKPSELSPLLTDYIEACREQGIFSLRIIHGKGQGIQRERVHRFLKQCPEVASFQPAPPEAGGWGATLATLKRP